MLSDQAFIRAYRDVVQPAPQPGLPASATANVPPQLSDPPPADEGESAPATHSRRKRPAARVWYTPIPEDGSAESAPESCAPPPAAAPTPADGRTETACGPPVTTLERWEWPPLLQRLAGDLEQEPPPQIHPALTEWRGTLGVAGVSRAQGCTTTTLWLARRLAARGASVVAVDADFANPALAKQLNWQPDFGWQAVLAGDLTVETAVVADREEGIAVLPLTAPVDDPWPRLETAIADTLARLGGRYDVVLVDAGPWFAAQPKLCDGLLLVADTGQTSAAEARLALSALAATRAPVIGLCDNFVAEGTLMPASLDSGRTHAA